MADTTVIKNNKFVTEEGLAEYDRLLNDYLPPIKRGSGINSFEHNGTATGDYSHAEGCNTLASKHSSHAEGLGTKATGETAHAEGDCTQASGLGSHAEGSNTLAFGVHSHAEGYSRNIPITINLQDLEATLESWNEAPCTIAMGQGAHAEGGNTFAFGIYSHTEGEGTLSKGYSSHAEGLSSQAIGNYSHAEGEKTTATGRASHAEGYSQNLAENFPFNSDKQVIINAWENSPFILAWSQSSHAEGSNTLSLDHASHAEGIFTKATGQAAHAEGEVTQAIGRAAHTEGFHTHASEQGSHAEGVNTHASGQGSHAEGVGTVKLGSYDPVTLYELWKSASESFLCASGNGAHAEGGNTLATGFYSHTEGYLTAATNQGAHAEGCGQYDDKEDIVYPTLAKGLASHAEGYCTTAEGPYSHAEGYKTRAEGQCMHVEGSDCYGTGSYSHVGGGQSHSDYTGAFVHGLSCSSSREYQTVFGRYNNEDPDAAFIIGNGNKSSPKNIFTVKADGKVELSMEGQGDLNKQILYFKNTTGFGAEDSSKGFFKLWVQNFRGGDNKLQLTLVPSINDTMALGQEDRYFRSIFGTNIYCSMLNGQSAPGTSSDSRLKNSIALFDDRYEKLFDGLQGKTYKYNEGTSNRTHLGFIAQEVQTAIVEAGLTEQDCAVVCTISPGEDDEFLTLRYGEFVALNTWQIQKLKSRVQELENKIALLEEKLAD